MEMRLIIILTISSNMNYLQYMQRPAGPINNIPASLAAFQPEEEDMSPRKAFPNPKSDFERFVNTLPYN